MIQKKHNEVSACPHMTIMVVVGLLFCLSVPIEVTPNPSIPNFDLVKEPALGLPSDRFIGRVKVQTTVNGPYDDICAASPKWHYKLNDITATAICRNIGFNATHAKRIPKVYPPHAYNYLMYNLSCLHHDYDFQDCTYKLDTQNQFGDFCVSPLFVNCHNHRPEEWKFRIQPDTQGNTPSIGLLEVDPNPFGDWGTVCSNMFNNYSALMMCKAIGFTDITSARAILNYSSDKPSTGSKRTTYLTDVVCDESSTSLRDCEYVFHYRGISSSVCNDMTDVGIDCSGVPTSAEDSKGSSALPIVLGVLGAVVLVGLAVGGIIMYKKRSRSSNVKFDSNRVDYVPMEDSLNDE